MQVFLSCVLVVAILDTVIGQTVSMGNCDPELKGMDNFDKTKYTGKWYEYQRSWNFAEKDTKCYRNEIFLFGDSPYDIIVSSVNKNGDGTFIDVPYSAKIIESEAQLDLVPGLISDMQPLWILSTDYDNYTVCYTCMNLHRGKLEFVWIMTRTLNPDKSIITKAEEVLEDRQIKLPMITEVHDCV